jgi:TonB family protein
MGDGVSLPLSGREAPLPAGERAFASPCGADPPKLLKTRREGFSKVLAKPIATESIRRIGMRIRKLSVLFLMLAGFCLLASVGYATQSRQAKKVVKPSYPAAARELRVEGTVRLQAVVDRDGNVENVIVVSGHALLKPAAVECVKQWKYEPSGDVSLVPIEIVFHLDN